MKQPAKAGPAPFTREGSVERIRPAKSGNCLRVYYIWAWGVGGVLVGAWWGLLNVRSRCTTLAPHR